ncbi:hypothetical protein AB0F17_11905 [Nonomuraea sp. NPDC026600]|uniref:hypothetical protein n=1 Tax=Nonomuraea sp. NPDC026600 TaxID=3155363 RepID=UPI0033F218CD
MPATKLIAGPAADEGVRDYERLSEHHEAMVLWSMIILMHGGGNSPLQVPEGDAFAVRRV